MKNVTHYLDLALDRDLDLDKDLESDLLYLLYGEGEREYLKSKPTKQTK